MLQAHAPRVHVPECQVWLRQEFEVEQHSSASAGEFFCALNGACSINNVFVLIGSHATGARM